MWAFNYNENHSNCHRPENNPEYCWLSRYDVDHWDHIFTIVLSLAFVLFCILYMREVLSNVRTNWSIRKIHNKEFGGRQIVAIVLISEPCPCPPLPRWKIMFWYLTSCSIWPKRIRSIQSKTFFWEKHKILEKLVVPFSFHRPMVGNGSLTFMCYFLGGALSI